MKKYLFFLLVLATGCAAQRPIPLSEAFDNDNRYVVILSMDAFRWDLADRAFTPTLDSLKRVGSYAEIYPVFPSNTFPSHYAMATGLHPDHHGVVNNGFYDKSIGRRLSVFDREDVLLPGFWGGEPIWNTAERQGRTANIFMWPGSDVPIGGRQATIWTPYSDAPDYYERADWVTDALTRPVEDIPNLVMWYFEQPDAAMHTYGPSSDEAIAQAEHIDSVLRYFFSRVRRSPVFDRINFIVTADHGMTELSPDRTINLYEILDTTQILRTVNGTPLGLEIEETYVDEALRLLRRTGHLKAWRREKMPSKYHYGSHPMRLTNVIVLPDMGWTVEYASHPRGLRGKQGTHGYDNFGRDMHMVFYGSGPAFRAHYRQRSFQNQNIYLILCHLLGIEPAPNDGEWRDVRSMFRE